MGKIFKAVRSVYSRFTPESIRTSGFMARAKELVPHELMYDAEYYVEAEEHSRKASATISELIMADFKPRSVIDVGCGTGALLGALRDRGCEVFGLEYAEAGLAFCRARKLNVRKFDLERETFDVGRTFDVAVSTEVAEHLPERCADRYVDLLTGAAPKIVFTAAFPGQGGTDHVNEQPASYWIAKFAARGFSFEELRSQEWRRRWREADIARWYWMNAMIFAKSDLTSR
jgi:SAM-dependent methyltransferase